MMAASPSRGGDNGPLLPVGGPVYDFGKFLRAFETLRRVMVMHQSYNLYDSIIGDQAALRSRAWPRRQIARAAWRRRR